MNNVFRMRRHAAALFTALCVTHPELHAQQTEPPPARYVITASASTPRLVHVDAHLPLMGDTIRMSTNMYDRLEQGWATFVSNLVATDGANRKLVLQQLRGGKWHVTGQSSGTINLSYDVAVQQDTIRWETSAAFARGYAVDGATFVTGRVLFITTPAVDTGRVRITFKLPPEWSVVSAYPDVAGAPNEFEVAGSRDLMGNGTMFGRLSTATVSQGPLRVSFAASPAIGNSVQLYAQSIAPVIAFYDSVMGGSPKGKLAVLASVSPLADGGEALYQSISLMQRQPPSLANRSRWAYLIAHETFHLWNGSALNPSNRAEVEWFAEGFTDYMAKIAAHHTGLMTEKELLEQIASSYDRYRAGAGKVSMKAGGAQKGPNRSLLYYGGMSVAMALDVDALERSGGRTGLPELMRAMYSQYGPGRPYSYDDLVRTLSAASGVELRPFFQKYVEGTATVPLDEYLRKAGLAVRTDAGSTLISPSRNPTAAELQLRRALLRPGSIAR